MKNNIASMVIFGLISAFFMTATVKASDAIVEQDKLQAQDQVREQDQLKVQEKLQKKDQVRLNTGEDAAGPADGEKATLQKQEKARLMKGTEKTKGEAVRESAENAGEGKSLKKQSRSVTGDEKALRKQERRQDRRQLRTKAHSAVDCGSGSESRIQNRGESRKRR
jgi:hypothetical protein